MKRSKAQRSGHARINLFYNLKNPPNDRAPQGGLDDSLAAKVVRETDITRGSSGRTDEDPVTELGSLVEMGMSQNSRGQMMAPNCQRQG